LKIFVITDCLLNGGIFSAGCVSHSVFGILFACLFVFAVIFSGINLKGKVATVKKV